MGRKKKYITNEQKQEARRKDDRLYYERHKESILRKRMQQYWNGLETKLSKM